ncbi:exonuclease [Colletotrichum higginsianum]|uniref:Exonuclease n=2 Tax=Colletotrichum higginsianum TaxID=80884 RepID=H1UWP2_COLHI|nr:Exonuclease [Colletotrichum higginsianum IMI 349063]OBR07200.1 Exonuclease [Colletotrichum higginsianum IMI 349063]CCF32393.1 exonuclease [Colletotrichum higginsianum]
MSFVDLKHIPCPAGDRCTAFQCLFQHKDDRDKMAALSAPAPAPKTSATLVKRSSTDTTTTDATQGGPRKRLKTVQDVRTPTDSARTPPPVKTTSKQDTTAPRPDDILSAVARPISPPPLKRPSSSSTAVKKAPNSGPVAPSVASSDLNKPLIHSTTPIGSSPLSAVNHPSRQNTTTSVTTPASTASSHTPLKSITSKADSSPKPKPRKPEALTPRLLKSSPAKFDIRYKLVQMLHSEYTRLNNELKKTAKDAEEKQLILTDQDLIWRVLDEEETTAIEKGAIYSNVIKNKIMQYKKMTVLQWKDERVVQSRQQTQKGPHKKPLASPKKILTGLTPAQEVRLVRQLITPIDDLAVHGYVSSVPAEADIKKAREGLEAAKGWEKCDRCDKRFQMFPGRREEDGALASGGTCTFHWGKTYFPERQLGDRSQQPKRYRCCGQAVGDSAGCHTNPHHVFKASDPKRLATILNYAETPANPNAPSDRAVCFDCEMCYTVHGLELVRLTATAWPTGEELLDVLVQPVGEIIDLNSRYSGVWPEDMASAEPWTAQKDDKEDPTPAQAKKMPIYKKNKKKMKIVSSPEVARDLLFSLIAPDTPLIGHGLENDLNSVRIVHPTVIDTVLLFPHKHGLPYRQGLKMLMDNLLNRKIQVETAGKVQGHDSAEDARAAGDLVRFKLSEEWKSMKLLGWKLEGNEFIPPGGKVDDFQGQLTVEFLESAL